MNGNRKIKWPRMLQIDRIKCNYMHTNTNVHEADDSQVNKIIIIDYLNNTQCTLQTVGLIIIDILNPLIKWYFELKYLLSFLHCRLHIINIKHSANSKGKHLIIIQIIGRAGLRLGVRLVSNFIQ